MGKGRASFDTLFGRCWRATPRWCHMPTTTLSMGDGVRRWCNCASAFSPATWTNRFRVATYKDPDWDPRSFLSLRLASQVLFLGRMKRVFYTIFAAFVLLSAWQGSVSQAKESEPAVAQVRTNL